MSALVTLDGQPVVACQVSLPRNGVWAGELVVEADSAPEGRCTLAIGELELEGTAYRGAADEGAATVRVIGGAGGLGQTAVAKSYRYTPLRIPLEDLLGAGGEALSADSDADVLSLQLDHWATLATYIGAALSELVEGVPETSWRVQPDGSLWVGRERWQEAPAFEFEPLHTSSAQMNRVIYAQSPTVLPGNLFEGARVSYVEHVLRDDRLRTTLWLEGGA